MTIQYGDHQPAVEYKIIDTDYTSYSIEYQCEISLGFQRVEYIWIMSKIPMERDSPAFAKME